jgi:aspartyl-tRNA(Asn)/glutamyl-tRNA(Gln) amidotransferase subunit A
LPFNIGEKIANPLEMYLADIYTVNINIAGIPAISLPSGFSEEGLPIGLQLIGDHFTEKKLLKVAYHLEKELSINKVAPLMKEVD